MHRPNRNRHTRDHTQPAATATAAVVVAVAVVVVAVVVTSARRRNEVGHPRTWRAPPVSADSLREAAPQRRSHGHARERRKHGRGPRGEVEQGSGHRAASATTQLCKETLPSLAYSSEHRHTEGHQAHTRRQRTVLGDTEAVNVRMRRTAHLEGALMDAMGGTGRVKRLDINQDV